MPKGTKILMVDDDKMLIDLYKERLELAGYTVEISRDGEEGLAKIHSIKPDLVLLDIMMPKVNGYEALASIKSDPTTKNTPVIILSALMRDINKTKAVESGADDYIIKSEAMPADVIKKIESVLKKYNKTAPAQPAATAPTPVEAPTKAEEAQPNTIDVKPTAEINFEPASGGHDLAADEAKTASAAAVTETVPAANAVPETPVAPTPPPPPLAEEHPIISPQVETQPLETPPATSYAPPEPPSQHTSPVLVFFLVLIVVLILASDLFFYMKLVVGQ